MTRSAAEIAAMIDAARQLPYGRGQIVALEQATAEADASTDPDSRNLRVFARLDLVTAYNYGGEHPRMFTPFSWLVTRLDSDPGDFDDEDRWRLFWYFKWTTVGMLDYPEVPLERIEGALDDMERRYRAAGEGLAPVLGCRYKVAGHVRGHAAAVDAYRAWVEAPRTRLSDCEACEPTARARFLLAASRDDDAVAELEPVLDGRSTCEEQPQAAIARVLLPLVRTGRGDRARHEHVRGLRLVRRSIADLSLVARHVHFCAVTGNEPRGLDILEEHLPLLDKSPNPASRLDLTAAGALVLRRLVEQGHGSRPVQMSGEETPIAALYERLLSAAAALAAEFDARNGTTSVSDRIRAVLYAEPLAEVSLGGVSRPLPPSVDRPAGARDARAAAVQQEPAQARRAELAELSPEQLNDRLVQAFRYGTIPELDALLAAYGDRRDSHLAAAGDAPPATRKAVARLEALSARNSWMDGRADERLFASFETAAQLAASAGDPAEGALHALWAPAIAAHEGDRGHLERATALLGEIIEHGSPEQVARGHQRLATVARAVGDEARARALLRAGLAAVAGLDDIDVRGARGWLLVSLAEVEAMSGNSEAAVAAARSALATVGPDEWLPLRAQALDLIGRVLGDAPDGAGLLAEAARAAERAGSFEDATHARAHAASALLYSDDPAGAVRELTAVLTDVDRHLPPRAGAEVRLDLAIALRQTDRPAEAAEVAETGLRLVQPGQDDQLRGALAHHAAGAASDLGDHAEALRLGILSAESHRAAGTTAGGAASLEIAALAAERLDEPADAAELWRQMAEDATAADDEEMAVVALRCRPLCLAVAGDLAGAAEALAVAEQRLADSDLDADDAVWQRAALDVQRLKIARIAGRARDGVEAGLRGARSFDDIGDVESADTARVLVGRALIEAGEIDAGLTVLRDAAEAAWQRSDPEAARDLGGELANALHEAGRFEEAEQTWQRYSGDDD